MENEFCQGKTEKVWDWLKNNIYRHGRYFNSEELCKAATGKVLNSKYFIDYLKNKYLQ